MDNERLHWARVLTEGFLPQLTTRQIVTLRDAVLTDSEELCQKQTCNPVPFHDNLKLPPRRCCLMTYPIWKEGGLDTVDDAVNALLRVIREIDKRCGVLSYDALLQWYDETPRDEMRAKLLPILDREIKNRKSKQARH